MRENSQKPFNGEKKEETLGRATEEDPCPRMDRSRTTDVRCPE